MDTVTVASFRASFPEFASADIFPDSSITFWLNWAYLLLNADRWRSFTAGGNAVCGPQLGYRGF
jgi:hypothetical protein